MPTSTELPRRASKLRIEPPAAAAEPQDIPACQRSTGPFLWPGLLFRGEQKDVSKHDVEVLIQDVDYDRGVVCGYITTSGLAEDLAVLSTYFEGEIVSPFFGFRTQHPEWGATWENDLDHWRKFAPFRELRGAESPGFVLRDYAAREFIFMRWKELFPVPDYRLTVRGASYQGFYYVCLNQRTGAAVGYYFQREQPAKLQDQLLELTPVPSRFRPSYEFR